jgi:hypothetical protein
MARDASIAQARRVYKGRGASLSLCARALIIPQAHQWDPLFKLRSRGAGLGLGPRFWGRTTSRVFRPKHRCHDFLPAVFSLQTLLP